MSHPGARPHAGEASVREGADPLTDGGLLVLVLIWGVNFSVIKVALAELHPFAFNALRFPLACLVLYVLLRMGRGLAPPRREHWARLAFLGLLGNVAYQFLFIIGIDRTTAGNASLLLATTPIWTSILSVVRGHERPTGLVWLGILTTVVGMVIVILGGQGLTFERGTLVGDVLMIAAAMTWSLYTVGSRNLVREYGALPVTAWTLWIGSVGLVILGAPWVVRTDLANVSGLAWLAVVYAGCMAISVAYTLWYRGVGRLGSARTAAYSNLVPVVALGVAWAWLDEVPGPLQIVGAGVILAGLSVTRLARPRQRTGA
jgi:drug/metabolite transporter (DMT)-like permease